MPQHQIKNYLSLVKFSHTVFALPFALIGYVLANRICTGMDISYLLLIKVLACMVFARSSAMAFNRYLDRDIDAQNKRTMIREIPMGIIPANAALAFVAVNAGLFVFTTWTINSICFYLSPVALLVVLGYSYTKRFTALCHLVLGLGLSLSPIGAYLAVCGEFAWQPLLYSFLVLFWVSGFDIIYALQDREFDTQMKLNSIPVLLGNKKALLVSRLLHTAVVAILLVLYFTFNYTLLFLLAVMVFVFLLTFQHRLVKHDDLSKVDMAFFTSNGIASVVFGVLVILDLFFR